MDAAGRRSTFASLGVNPSELRVCDEWMEVSG